MNETPAERALSFRYFRGDDYIADALMDLLDGRARPLYDERHRTRRCPGGSHYDGPRAGDAETLDRRRSNIGRKYREEI